jgi:hypothetical protein
MAVSRYLLPTESFGVSNIRCGARRKIMSVIPACSEVLRGVTEDHVRLYFMYSPLQSTMQSTNELCSRMCVLKG